MQSLHNSFNGHSIDNCTFRNNMIGIQIIDSGSISIIRSNFYKIHGTAISILNCISSEIADCLFFENNSTTYGGAINIEKHSEILVNRCKFFKNMANLGGAIYFANSPIKSTINVTDCVFVENSSPLNLGSGGAILVNVLGNFSISGSNFSKNNAFGGSAISLGYLLNTLNYSRVTINNCLFCGNTIGSVIYVANHIGDIIIFQNVFLKNVAQYGVAILLVGSEIDSWLEINSCIFFENNSTQEGKAGGVLYFVKFGNASVIQSNFSRNFVNYSGMIFADSPIINSLMNIINCIFNENNAIFGGGAIFLSSFRNIFISGSNFTKNWAFAGSALYFSDSQNSIIQINDCVFSENNSSNSWGTVFLMGMSHIFIIQSIFSNNLGGAIIFIQTKNESNLKIIDSHFISNNSTTWGGAIYLKNDYGIASKIFINQSLFSDNIATNLGGAIYLENFGDLSMTNIKFEKNFASSGGAIYLSNSQNGSILQISDCSFFENNATGYAGAIYLNKIGHTSIQKNIFTKNFASFGVVISSFNQSKIFIMIIFYKN